MLQVRRCVILNNYYLMKSQSDSQTAVSSPPKNENGFPDFVNAVPVS